MAHLPQSIGSTIDMLLVVGLDTLIGALVLAVLIAALTAGAYLWLRRGKSDVSAVLITLILLANLTCLVTGAAFIQSKHSLKRTGPIVVGQEDGTIHMPRRGGRPDTAWRRTSYPHRGTANRAANAVEAPVN
jgi:hypothetical protein